jgi:hypothetical protein
MSGPRSEDPNTDGPLNTPWYVWLALLGVVVFALWHAASSDDQRGPLDEPTPSIPTRPSVIMPAPSSWS